MKQKHLHLARRQVWRRVWQRVQARRRVQVRRQAQAGRPLPYHRSLLP